MSVSRIDIFFIGRFDIWITFLYRFISFARLAKEMGVTWSVCTFHNRLLISSQGDVVKIVWKQSCKSFVQREIIINQWSYNIHQTTYAIFSLFTLFVKQNKVEQYLQFIWQNMFTLILYFFLHFGPHQFYAISNLWKYKGILDRSNQNIFW